MEGLADRRRHGIARHGYDAVRTVVETLYANRPRIRRGQCHAWPSSRATFCPADAECGFLGDSHPAGGSLVRLADPGIEPWTLGRLSALVPSNPSLLRSPARLAIAGCQAVRGVDCSGQIPASRWFCSILARKTHRQAQPGDRTPRFSPERGPGGGPNYTVRIHRLEEVKNLGNQESRPTASRRVLGNGLYCRLARQGIKHYPRRLTRRGL